MLVWRETASRMSSSPTSPVAHARALRLQGVPAAKSRSKNPSPCQKRAFVWQGNAETRFNGRNPSKDKKDKKQNNYVKTDRSTGRAQSDAITRARNAASASDDSSEV